MSEEVKKITYDEKHSLSYWADEDRLENVPFELMERLKVHNPDVHYMIQSVEQKEKELEYTKKALKSLIDNIPYGE